MTSRPSTCRSGRRRASVRTSIPGPQPTSSTRPPWGAAADAWSAARRCSTVKNLPVLRWYARGVV
ncbi:hypothetical protein ACFFGJ_01205 [Cellulomonas phragmiteti]